jgi:hypothetical protein
MSRKYFSLDRKAGRFLRHPAPSHCGRRFVGVVPLFCVCSISAAASSISGDDADRFLKQSKPCGCTVSTMGLSEARGLVLFQVIRGGIGVTQRLGATGTVSSTGHSHTHPRTRASQNRLATTRKDPEMERALHPRRSSGLRFQFFDVEVFSLLPQRQRDRCHLAR